MNENKYKNYCHPELKDAPINLNGKSKICRRRCDEKHRKNVRGFISNETW